MINLKTLDCKTQVKFFDDSYDIINNNCNAQKYTFLNNTIWTISNFLSNDECDSVINTCENVGFDNVEWRNSSRLMVFEDNEKLENIIKLRLKDDGFLNRLNTVNHVKPYGFHSDTIQWSYNTEQINNCFRINKYEKDQGFYPHRDAQYTESSTRKSNYTMLIYLNDDFEDGETEFFIPLKDYINTGYLINEELRKFPFIKAPFKPRKGMAIIFDQRLIHKGKNVLSGTKYVLRTDMICNGEKYLDYVSTIEELTYKLCRGIFRQAQYQELDKSLHDNTSKLYEICIALRQMPHLITEYPAHLEKYLINTCNVTVNIDPILTFIARDGMNYTFTYIDNLSLDKETMIKVAYLYAILTCTNAINKFSEDEINTRLKKVCDLYGVYKNIDASKHKVIKYDVETRKYLAKSDISYDDYNMSYLMEKCSNRDEKRQLEKFINDYNTCNRFSEERYVDMYVDQQYYTSHKHTQYDVMKIFPELTLRPLLGDEFKIPRLNTTKMNYRCPYSIYTENTVNNIIGVTPTCGICISSARSNNEPINPMAKDPITTKMISHIEPGYDKNDNNLNFDITLEGHEDNWYGDISISVLSEPINHASCQCETFFSTSKIDKTHTIIDLHGIFRMNDHELVITLEPQIVM